jgi:hypothetical protein
MNEGSQVDSDARVSRPATLRVLHRNVMAKVDTRRSDKAEDA